MTAAWWEDTEKLMHDEFEKTVVPVLQSANVTPNEEQFRLWRDKNIEAAGGREKMEQACYCRSTAIG